MRLLITIKHISKRRDHLSYMRRRKTELVFNER